MSIIVRKSLFILVKQRQLEKKVADENGKRPGRKRKQVEIDPKVSCLII